MVYPVPLHRFRWRRSFSPLDVRKKQEISILVPQLRIANTPFECYSNGVFTWMKIFVGRTLSSLIIKNKTEWKKCNNAFRHVALISFNDNKTHTHQKKPQNFQSVRKKRVKKNQANSINSQKNVHRSSLTILFICCYCCCCRCDNDSVFIYACLPSFCFSQFFLLYLPFRFHFSHIIVWLHIG